MLCSLRRRQLYDDNDRRLFCPIGNEKIFSVERKKIEFFLFNFHSFIRIFCSVFIGQKFWPEIRRPTEIRLGREVCLDVFYAISPPNDLSAICGGREGMKKQNFTFSENPSFPLSRSTLSADILFPNAVLFSATAVFAYCDF